MSCQTCGFSPCRCNPCAPATTVFNCGCEDPGLATRGWWLPIYDSQFCLRRLDNGMGFLVNHQDASGNWHQEWTDSPDIALASYQAVQSQTFGNLIVIGSDGVWRQLLGPATANLFPRTNAAGDLIFDVLPTFSVPDPLAVTTLTVGGLATLNNVNIGGSVNLASIATGTAAALLALDAGNNVVKTNIAISAAMFFESASSPAASYPNAAIGAGAYLIIGNTLYDSGASLITVTNSTTLTVAKAGKYVIWWQASFNKVAAAARPSAGLEINGTVVNRGGGMTNSIPQNNNAYLSQTGFEIRALAVGDVIRLLNGPTSAPAVYEVRLGAVKFSD